ncbi:MAG: large subunit ribosomal protein L10 [Planctomycetota bacterium]|jgi:large subunit ribosomal protein L10
MAITREQKVEMLGEMGGIIDSAESVTFVQFNQLSVEDTTAMRAKLREEGVGYKVMKKTLIKRALEAAGISGDLPELEGNIAIAYAEGDPTASAREVYEFAKSRKEKISIVGGIFEGRFQSNTEMNEIATIPSLQVLRGMFVNVINSPIQGMAVVLQAIADKREA